VIQAPPRRHVRPTLPEGGSRPGEEAGYEPFPPAHMAGTVPLAQPEKDRGQEAPERHLRLVPRPSRHRANRRRLAVPVVIGAAAFVSMGLVALHVLIAENQFKLDNLQQQASSQQAGYEKLRLEVAQLESPSRIVSVAERLGMRQPGSVTYLPAIAREAQGSASNPAGRPGVTGASGGAAGAVTSGDAGAGGPLASAGALETAPEGDADWPTIKPYLSGSP